MQRRTHNDLPTSVLQDCGVSAFLETLVLIESLGIFRNFSAKSPQPRKALKR
jgi:hypothetical protein